jgi:hypothetical protein
VRTRCAVIAILVALAAVAAGAQAAAGDGTGTSSGTVRLQSRQAWHPKHITLLSERSLTRTSGGADDYHSALQVSNFTSGTPGVPASGACRFPNVCGFNGDNFGATLQGGGEGNTCVPASGGSSQGFNSTVWFRVATGGVAGTMFIQIDNASAFNPVFLIAAYNTSTSTPVFPAGCDIGNSISHVYSSLFGIRGNISMAVASPDPPNTQGTYRVLLSWDPDTDGDNQTDSNDRCPTQRGPSSLRGCPDTDGDGIPNIDDSCDTLRGPRIHNGCPDSDGDNLIDPFDACPFESALGRVDRNHNGCPDYLALPNLSASTSAGSIRGGVIRSVRVKLKFVDRAPRGTKVTIKCKPRRNCSLRRSGKLSRRIKSVSLRTRRTLITVTATKRGYIGKVLSFKAGYNRARGGGRNILAGSSKNRCIPIGKRTSRKCSSSLFLR